MAKYYVQSGQLKMVMDASDAGGAALWALHSKLGELAFIYEGNEYTEQQQIDQVMVHALIELEPTILVSERGFGRTDADNFETFDIAMQWHQLAKALTRIEDR
jgi:hypothetical protein